MNRSRRRNFWSNTSGVAVVEFAVIFPVLLLLLLGTFEITRAVIAHKKVQKIAYTVDHLLTKAPAMNKKSVQDTLRASEYILVPFAGSAAIDVFYQYKNSSGNVTERWTQGIRDAGMVAVTSRPLPASYEALRETGFLTTYVRYTHQAVFPSLFFDQIEMSAESTVRPRPGVPLSCADC